MFDSADGRFAPTLSLEDAFSDRSVFEAVMSDNVATLRGAFARDISDPLDDNGHFHAILQARPPLLCVCCFFGSCESIEFALERGANLAQADGRNRTCFHFAAAGNQPDVLDRIWVSKSALLAADADGLTPLHHAAESDAADVFEWYLRVFGRADVFEIETVRGTPLHCACRNHSTKCFRFLVGLNMAAMQNPPINFNRPLDRDNPILLLLAASAYELIPLGVRAGMAIDGEEGSCPPIIEAAYRGDPKFVRALCRLGADVNKRHKKQNQEENSEEETALSVAAMPGARIETQRRLEVCRILIDAGAIVHYVKFGPSPFQGAGPEAAELIKRHEIDFLTRAVIRKLIEQMYPEIESDVTGHDFFPLPGSQGCSVDM